jgi:hypothetical protein
MKGKFQFACAILENRAVKKVRNRAQNTPFGVEYW